MNNDIYKKSALRLSAAISATLGIALIAPAYAQTSPSASGAGFELEEVVVSARRRDESLQDVPSTINAVTGAEIEKLNIRRFEDIASVVPGLQMAPNAGGFSTTASVRGVNYEGNASGNNGTIEFYLNDAPISAGSLFQAMYDVQQVELLRGPQGTLRGRASPSGSMTVTTRRPDLREIGGYVSTSANNIGGYNGQGAFNFPIISDVLAIRVAGIYDKNEVNRAHSLNSSADPESKTKSGRATVRFDPTDSLSFVLTYQHTQQDVSYFDQVESQQVVKPGAPINSGFIAGYIPPFITASDHLAVEDVPRTYQQNINNFNLQAQWAFLGQKLNYVGKRDEAHIYSYGNDDIGDYFGPGSPAVFQGYGQSTNSRNYATAHELRLSSEERVAGFLDYIVGGFYQKSHTPSDLKSITPLTFNNTLNVTPVARGGGNLEKSVFVNVTAHITDKDELSVGGRHIKYHSDGTLAVNNVINPAATEDSDFSANIYSATFKHNFSDNLMVYASTGSSWRPGISTVGDFSLQRSAQENAFLLLPPEKSTSYEIGFKATALDRRLRASVDVYHQKFDNFVYRSGAGAYYASLDANARVPGTNIETVKLFNFVAAVPATVNGVEAEINFTPIAALDVGLVGSYANGKIKNGLVPCNDYAPTDGIPDGAQPASPAVIHAATGDNVASCKVNYRSSIAPQWSGTLQSEYRLPLNDSLTSFARGLLSIYGDSQNDPSNPVDDYSSYMLLNLYLGVRAPNSNWEVAVYGKNVTNTERVLSRSPSPVTASPNGSLASSNYNGGVAGGGGLTMTAPREFGVTLRYAFGSK